MAGFNKGFSGGGYGAITSGGQVLLGISEKRAIGVTLFSEGLTSLFGMFFYAYYLGFPDWRLTFPLIIGGILSIPIAGITVKHLSKETIRKVMGIIASFLGVLFIVKIFL